MADKKAPKRGMDAVIEKASSGASGKRTPVMKRKNPALAIMIAVGKPKPGADGEKMGTSKGTPYPAKVAKGKPTGTLEERIAALEAHCYGESDSEDDTEEDDD